MIVEALPSGAIQEFFERIVIQLAAFPLRVFSQNFFFRWQQDAIEAA